jgi:hypothetical protein
MVTYATNNSIDIVKLENASLSVEIAPALGGKISSIYNKALQREFLWINHNIPFARHSPGSDYDQNFIGGADELLPNDAPEEIDSINYPDHGELWTTVLQPTIQDNSISVHGRLALCGLSYTKTVSLEENEPYVWCRYVISNESDVRRHFLWKLHAALLISPGDRLVSTARQAQVVDPDYCRFKNELSPFAWPIVEGTDASVVPSRTDKMDFFYLFDTPKGNMQLVSGNAVFAYDYDAGVFPYQWWFASYGGFLGHYTAILEPCTNMPMMVNDAIARNQSAFLEPGKSLQTSVRIYAGEINSYIPL